MGPSATTPPNRVARREATVFLRIEAVVENSSLTVGEGCAQPRLGCRVGSSTPLFTSYSIACAPCWIFRPKWGGVRRRRIRRGLERQRFLNTSSAETPIGVATASVIWEHAFPPTVDRRQSPGL